MAKIAEYGCNVFINRQLIYNHPEQLLLERGITPIEHSDFDGMERLAAALGAEIVSTFDAPSEVSCASRRDEFHRVFAWGRSRRSPAKISAAILGACLLRLLR